MKQDANQHRKEAHALLDLLPAEKISIVRSLLEVMVEPLDRSLAFAPLDHEDVSAATAEAVERARASLGRGEGVSHEEIRREFGLS